MRESIKQFVEICAKTLPISEPIYEFGAFQVSGQEGFADLRPLFPGKEYVGADMRKGPGVDVTLNLHHIDLPPESVGTVLLLDTLEHVELPRKAIENIHGILKPDGVLIMSSVMNFPIHDYPSDYWRFTPEGFRVLMRSFTSSFVGSIGNTEFPHTIIGLGLKNSIPHDYDEFRKQFEVWKQCWSETTQPQPMWKRLIKQFVPPIALTTYRATRSYKNISIRRKN